MICFLFFIIKILVSAQQQLTREQWAAMTPQQQQSYMVQYNAQQAQLQQQQQQSASINQQVSYQSNQIFNQQGVQIQSYFANTPIDWPIFCKFA